MEIWVVGTTRNEVDLVDVHVRHHFAQGVDQFLLLDNGSSDGTPEMLEHLSGTYPVRWRPYAGPFLQDRLLSALADEARAAGADWIVPIDADEFWTGQSGSLRDILAEAPADAVRVPVVNFIQRRSQRHTTPEALLTMTHRTANPVGPVHRGEEYVETERVAYVEQAYEPKWIFRASEGMRIGWGNHTSVDPSVRLAPVADIVCLHAPLRSLAVLEGKVDSDRTSREIDEYFEMAWHLGRWRRLAWEGRLEDEWAANSYDEGHLDVFGRRHPVVADDRLRHAVAPWLTR